MLSEDNLHNLYKANYMQNPFDILTQENLERLENHCKKTIHYEKNNLKEEHEIVLELLYKYQDIKAKEQKLIEKLEKDIAENPDAKYTKWYLADCLKIVKGEKE